MGPLSREGKEMSSSYMIGKGAIIANNKEYGVRRVANSKYLKVFEIWSIL
jgi:hypothetical protein